MECLLALTSHRVKANIWSLSAFSKFFGFYHAFDSTYFGCHRRHAFLAKKFPMKHSSCWWRARAVKMMCITSVFLPLLRRLLQSLPARECQGPSAALFGERNKFVSPVDDILRLTQMNTNLFGGGDTVVKFVLEGHDQGVNWDAFIPACH